MKQFEGVLICTDLDGTLLRHDGSISAENREAIEYFKQNGGYFTFVTGRMPFFVSHIYNAIHPNAPFGCINGGGLYDHVAQKYIWREELPKSSIEMVQYIERTFPQVGIQINTFEHIYFCKENKTMELFRASTGMPNLVRGCTEIEEPFGKIIFGSEDEEELRAVEHALRTHPMADQFDFIQSEKTLFEILPKGIGKGVAITKLVEYLRTDIRKTVAVGDYNNDISMFRAARIGVAVANACADAKAEADYVTVSNEEHAIAKVIEDLANGAYSL